MIYNFLINLKFIAINGTLKELYTIMIYIGIGVGTILSFGGHICNILTLFSLTVKYFNNNQNKPSVVYTDKNS